MGTSLSKEQRLQDLSTQDLAKAVEDLGVKYSSYGKAIVENGVDGGLLAQLDDEAFKETLQDLEISNRLHCRVLTKAWKELKEASSKPPVVESSTSRQEENSPKEAPQEKIPLKRSSRTFQAAASYDLTPQSPKQVLRPFDKIAEAAMEIPSVVLSGVNLLSDEGQVALSTRIRTPNGEIRTDRMNLPANKSICFQALMNQSEENEKGEGSDSKDFFVIKPDDKERAEWKQSLGTDNPVYEGHIVRSRDGIPVGMTCVITEASNGEDDDKKSILRELAAQAEDALQLRKVLLERTKTLKNQIATSEQASGEAETSTRKSQNEIALPAHGPLKAVTEQEVKQREKESPFPMPAELAASGKSRRTGILRDYLDNAASSPEELSHLSPKIWDLNDALGIKDRVPIPRNDRERVAVLESLRLQELDPQSDTFKNIQNLAEMAAKLLNVEHVELTFHDHQHQFAIVGRPELTTNGANSIKAFYKVLKNSHDSDSDTDRPFLICRDRGTSFCNYAMTSKKTFVVHDIHADESFEYFKKIPGSFRFYSGSPLIYQGHVVAVLCLFDWRPRPDYTKAHEIQQEQIASLILQQIDNWALRRDMNELEQERRRVSLHGSEQLKRSPPENKAAVIFTDVQGSTSMWEANSNAMNQAIALHDKIMRKCLADNFGYEVTTEGDAFFAAFHDSIDAVRFAMQAQEALYDAPWSDDILALPDACYDEQHCFRGLRVRMAIHLGDVTSRENEVSGRQEYTGKTVRIAKSLEHMSHGGQVVVTTDIWNQVSSYVGGGSEAAAMSKDGQPSVWTFAPPQALDLGVHVLLTGKSLNDGVLAKGVVQLVPQKFAFDYFAQWQDSEETSTLNRGRRFPPPITLRRLRSSFIDAPATKTRTVTMVFIYASEVEKLEDDPSVLLAALAKLIGSLLEETSTRGYQSKDFMLAFHHVSEAVAFGLALQDHLNNHQVLGFSLAGLLKVGVHEGSYTSMGPHNSTGRADYYGKVVNRAARVAGAATPGQVCLGTMSEEAPELASGLLETEFIGWRELKGVQEPMALHVCVRT